MNQIVLTGMVLSAAPIGEYDKRIVILTKERGKISAFAKGARRPNSPLIGAVNPFSFGEFVVYEGRTSYTIQSAHIRNYFAELRADITGAYYGFYFLEFANYYTREQNDEREMLKLLYQTLKALLNPHIPNPLVRVIFELKAVCINGEGPQVFQCVVCGCETPGYRFSVKKGGLVCDSCAGDVIDDILLDKSTLYSMQYIEGSRIEALYTFTVSEKVLDQLRKIMERYCDVYIDKQFKSLEILETLL
ncbi:DNA repair protein RecO [Mediterraneibacter massiliensis]|uniref:DNA repair protein RecO n=1 Tax=Mediterraneibacter massiliensis TaxID=1720300 RepID=UPI00073E8C84|nr:DNA repair protein RecO [Mediterraneibacter massiliensis]